MELINQTNFPIDIPSTFAEWVDNFSGANTKQTQIETHASLLALRQVTSELRISSGKFNLFTRKQRRFLSHTRELECHLCFMNLCRKTRPWKTRFGLNDDSDVEQILAVAWWQNVLEHDCYDMFMVTVNAQLCPEAVFNMQTSLRFGEIRWTSFHL